MPREKRNLYSYYMSRVRGSAIVLPKDVSEASGRRK